MIVLTIIIKDEPTLHGTSTDCRSVETDASKQERYIKTLIISSLQTVSEMVGGHVLDGVPSNQ